MPRRRRWLQFAWGTASLLVLAGLAMGPIMARFETRFIYYPEAAFVALPRHFGIQAEDVWLETDDRCRLHGWYCVPSGGVTPRAYLLFSHGNAGNISGRLPLVQELTGRGLAVMLYDYRGYGQSTGAPDEDGLYTDGEAFLAALVERAGDASRVILYGRSLGGGVSWELAVRHPEVAGVVSDCTFTSIPDMAGRLFPVPLIGTVVQTRFENVRKVSQVTAPKLLLHGERDELIPFAMGEALFEAALVPKRFVPLPGAGHNDTYLVDPDLYFGAIDTFVDEVVSPP